MNIAVFVSIWSAGMSPTALNGEFLHAPLNFLKNEPGVSVVEIYIPETGDVPKLDDVPAPAIMIQIDMDSAALAEILVQSDTFQRLFMNTDGHLSGVEKINLEIVEAVHYPLPGQEAAPARTAALSFVVRYYGPVKDQNQFVDFYTNNHPPILARFEGIRNVLCYLPLNWRTTGQVPDDRLIIGNEVVFDDLDALNRALQSDVLNEAMEDSQHFQGFGDSTHHAMRRKQVYSRPAD